jgi:hypothetical protein
VYVTITSRMQCAKFVGNMTNFLSSSAHQLYGATRLCSVLHFTSCLLPLRRVVKCDLALGSLQAPAAERKGKSLVSHKNHKTLIWNKVSWVESLSCLCLFLCSINYYEWYVYVCAKAARPDNSAKCRMIIEAVFTTCMQFEYVLFFGLRICQMSYFLV